MILLRSLPRGSVHAVMPQYVPVDTVICFRASIPLVVAVLDYLMMGRELPKLRSWLALTGASPASDRCTSRLCSILPCTWLMLSPCDAGVLVGAAIYTHHDVFFTVTGYVWLASWYILCIVDALLMKKITDTVPMSTFSRTLYNVCPKPWSAGSSCIDSLQSP